MSTVRLTMAQALIKFLDNQYIHVDGVESKFVKGIMGIFGHGNVTGLGEALEYNRGDLDFIQGKNEQGMVHAAVAFAKQKNRKEIYACTASIGPGSLNMITAAATATVNRIPVLLLPGDIFADRQPDPVLQQIEDTTDYTVSANDAFKPVSKYWDRITRPEQLIIAAKHAMRVLTDPVDTGAVTLSLPQDVQSEAYNYPLSFFKKRVHYVDRRHPSSEALQRVASLIKSKSKPLIIAGGGVHYSDALSELREFAEEFNIPVSETQAGKSAFPSDHPLYVGAIGVTGSLAANILAKESDLIIGVGSRFQDFTTASKSAFQQGNVDFISINVSTYDSTKLDALSLLSDAKVGLVHLNQILSKENYRSKYESQYINSLTTDWNNEVNRLYSESHPFGLSQARALGVINQFVDGNSVIVCAAGSLPGDLHRLWKSSGPKSYHMEYGFSCMGYEVSGAFGVKLAEENKEVYAVVGDGSYLMLHSEILTSIQQNRKITILLFDNNGYQCIHNLQRAHGSQGFGNEFLRCDQAGNEIKGQYVTIDYALHAKSMGLKTYTANSPEELETALFKAKDQTISTLIHIKVVPGTNTGGYESFWRVGVAEVSNSEDVRKAYEQMKHDLKKTIHV